MLKTTTSVLFKNDDIFFLFFYKKVNFEINIRRGSGMRTIFLFPAPYRFWGNKPNPPYPIPTSFT